MDKGGLCGKGEFDKKCEKFYVDKLENEFTLSKQGRNTGKTRDFEIYMK